MLKTRQSQIQKLDLRIKIENPKQPYQSSNTSQFCVDRNVLGIGKRNRRTWF